MRLLRRYRPKLRRPDGDLTMLARKAIQLRSCALAAMAAATALLAAFNPAEFPSWIPIRASCGAATGLPCVFCGMTRGLHHLLQGDWPAALYYNWLSLPAFAAALALASILGLELCLQRKIVRMPTLSLTPRSFSIGLTALALLWMLQVYLAVSQHKHELLNPRGPLYSLVVR